MATKIHPEVLGLEPESSTTLGSNFAKLDGTTSGWITYNAPPVQPNNPRTTTTNTVAGPTSGIESVTSSLPTSWLSRPLKAAATISGTVTVNVWAAESNMSANVAINVVCERVDNRGQIVSEIFKTTRTTEVAVTTAAVNNFTVTPTSTNMNKGDRFRIRIFGDDAGTMASGYTFSVVYGGTTPGASGDTWVQFNENLSFYDGLDYPSNNPPFGVVGTQFFLTAETGDINPGGVVSKFLRPTRNVNLSSAITNTQAGWLTPFQITDSAGGTIIEWYTKPLNAFTLTGIVGLEIDGIASLSGTRASPRAEVAVVNSDGSSPSIYGESTFNVAWSNTGVTNVWAVAGPDISVSGGQRIRLRIYLDDDGEAAMVSGRTVTVRYAGSSGGTGDSSIRITGSVTEQSGGAAASMLDPFGMSGFFGG